MTAINRRLRRVAILTEDDGYTIIDLTEKWDIAEGDVIAWDKGYVMGLEVYRNLTKNTTSIVFVQNHGVSKALLHAHTGFKIE